MNYKNVFAIFALLILAMPLAFADSATISPTSNDFGNQNIGASLSGSFSLTNSGTNVISSSYLQLANAKLTGVTESPAVSVSLTPSTINNFVNGTTQAVSYTFTVPNAYFGAYTGVIEFKNSANTLLSSQSFSLYINPVYSLSLTSGTASIVAGDTGNYNLTLANNGNAHLSAITFSSTDFVNTADSTDKITANNVVITTNANVDYQTSKNWNVQVNVPSGKVGTYQGTITAFYNGQQKSVNSTIVVVAENYASSIASSDVIWANTVTTQKALNFEITNTGNKALVNEICTLTAFKDNSGTEVIPTSSISPTSFSISNLAVGAKITKTATINNIPSTLDYGTYNAIFSCATSQSSKQISLTYREKVTSVQLPTSFSLGGSSQKRNQTISSTYTITNNGDVRLNNIQVTISGSKGLKFSDVNNTLTTISYLDAGQSRSLPLSVFVDPGFDSGSHSIGSIMVSSSDLPHSATGTVYVETKSMIDVTDAYVRVSGSKDSILPSSSASADIEPGSHVAVTIEVHSLFDENDDYEQDIDIDGVSFNVVIDDLDVDETSEEFTLKPDKESSKTIEFDVPYDLDSDDYSMDIEVTGEDDEGAEHKVVWTVTLNVNRDSRKLKVSDATRFLSDNVYCDGTAYLDVEVLNIGEKDLDNVVAEIKSVGSTLNYVHSEKDSELTNDYGASDNSLTINSLAIDLDQLGAKPGVDYKFLVTAYYNTVSYSDSKTLTLRCSEKPAKDTTDNTGSSSTGSSTSDDKDTVINVLNPSDAQQSGTTSSTTTGNSSTSQNSSWDDFRNSDAYVYVLVIGIVAIVLIFFFIISML